MVGTFCCQLLLSKEGMFFFSLCTFYKVESSLCGRNLNGVEWPSRGYFLALPGRKVSRLPWGGDPRCSSAVPSASSNGGCVNPVTRKVRDKGLFVKKVSYKQIDDPTDVGSSTWDIHTWREVYGRACEQMASMFCVAMTPASVVVEYCQYILFGPQLKIPLLKVVQPLQPSPTQPYWQVHI